MAAARYWRVVSVESYSGADLELSELQLHTASGRADVGATLTCSHVPTIGSLADLTDGSTATFCRFNGADVRSGGFVLSWDLGAGGEADVIGARVGGGANVSNGLASVMLQHLSGDSWVGAEVIGRIPWAGALALGEVGYLNSYATRVSRATPVLYWRLGETVGSVAADISGNNRAGTYTSDAAGFAAPGLVAGGGAIELMDNGNTQRGVVLASPPVDISAPWTVAFVARPSSGPPVAGVGCIFAFGGAGGPEVDVLDIGGGRFRLRVMQSGVALLFNSASSWAYGVVLAIALRHGSGGVRLTVNGAAEGQKSLTYSALTGPLRLGFAVFFGSTDYYPYVGAIAEYTMHQSELSDSALSGLAAAVPGNASTFLPMLSRAPAPSQMNIAASAVVSARSAGGASVVATARDVEFGGSGRIWGATKIELSPGNRVPAKGRVSILRERDKLLAREVWSDPVTGAWEVGGLDARQSFIALAQDPTGNYMPAAADRTRPEETP